MLSDNYQTLCSTGRELLSQKIRSVFVPFPLWPWICLCWNAEMKPTEIFYNFSVEACTEYCAIKAGSLLNYWLINWLRRVDLMAGCRFIRSVYLQPKPSTLLTSIIRNAVEPFSMECRFLSGVWKERECRQKLPSSAWHLKCTVEATIAASIGKGLVNKYACSHWESNNWTRCFLRKAGLNQLQLALWSS